MSNCLIKEADTYTFFCDNPDIVFEHGQEVCGNTFMPNVQVIKELSEHNLSKTFVLLKDSRPVGYCTFLLCQDTTQAQRLTAECLAFYVKKEFRGRPVLRLFNTAVSNMQALGAKIIKISAPIKNKTTWYVRQGFTALETVFALEV